MGTRIIKMDPAQEFSAQGAGAAVILASHYGFPLDHPGDQRGVMGVERKQARLRRALGWGSIVVAWLRRCKLRRRSAQPPAASAGFGTGATGPILIVLLASLNAVVAFGGRARRLVPAV
jgi:PiT family inorganic phosphate transporter